MLAGLGLLSTLAFLIWWNFLRSPTPPQILEFAAEDSRYTEANDDVARVRWQIEQPDQIQTLQLTGYSPEGDILSGSLIYEFKRGQLPAALQPFCTLQQALLSCSQIRNDAFQPGKYIFELLLTPKGRRAKPIALKTQPVEIAAKPLPIVTAIVPKSLVYREAAPGKPTPAEKVLPVADAAGIRLDWAVTMPQDVAALHLIGRTQDGKMIGDLWYEFPSVGQLPEALKPFCKLAQTLICRNVPTGLNAVGEYRLELQALTIEQPKTGQPKTADATLKTTEVIKIQSQVPQILSFQINGREAPAKLLIPVKRGQALPVVQLSWQVQGGATTRVEMSPAPGQVPLVGRVNFPLSPQGSITIALQVKTATGEVLIRSVALELYDPTPTDPPAIAAIKAASERPTPAAVNPTNAAPPTSSPAPTAALTAPPPAGSTAPTVDDQLSPIEQPPQFNGGR